MGHKTDDDLSSDFLFARPSFIEGVGRMLDLGGSLNVYNTSQDPDARAIYGDWHAIGDDVESALDEIRTEAATRS